MAIWHIGKAKEEIARLEADNARLTKELADATAALESNTSEVGKAAEQMEKDLATAKQTISTLTSERDALTGQLSAKDAEIKGLTEKVASQAEEVKVQVARQVQTTQAALGQPPIPTPPANATNGTSQLKGVARAAAGIKADLDKDLPPRRN